MTITKPQSGDYPSSYATYIEKVKGDDLVKILTDDLASAQKFINGIPEEKLSYRYAEGKWSIKEIMLHVTDAERIFAYRALRFARKDKTELPGFEENDYTPASNADSRSMDSIMSEFTAVRNATIELFKNLTEAQLNESGSANNKRISVRALGYSIAGHELHHIEVIRERYLK